MSSSSFDTINGALATGTIIAIVVGSVVGLAMLIGTIIAIVCIIKHLNRPRNAASRGMILQQPPQPYPYPQSWSNQYPPNTTSVSNYPPTYQTVAAPYTAPASNYIQPANK